ncbi:hypothetical protein BpHYR1_016940 [Brachionus plicatilis]|uniref:Uncharacterized protein n=1 Tax=Brachionus plicatilis TaxID=10195 RepID=A0A3M7SS59_BRAPC|nr:hypothetical protein BpHYR1_016940 [Brachionus plicatilis]
MVLLSQSLKDFAYAELYVIQPNYILRFYKLSSNIFKYSKTRMTSISHDSLKNSFYLMKKIALIEIAARIKLKCLAKLLTKAKIAFLFSKTMVIKQNEPRSFQNY